MLEYLEVSSFNRYVMALPKWISCGSRSKRNKI